MITIKYAPRKQRKMIQTKILLNLYINLHYICINKL